MPKKDEHLAKSEENETFVQSLDLSTKTGIGWATTITYYAALHYVEAYFSTVGGGWHFTLHKTRAAAIHRDPKLKHIHDLYCELEWFSREARYETRVFKKTDVSYCLGLLKRIKEAVLPLL